MFEVKEGKSNNFATIEALTGPFLVHYLSRDCCTFSRMLRGNTTIKEWSEGRKFSNNGEGNSPFAEQETTLFNS